MKETRRDHFCLCLLLVCVPLLVNCLLWWVCGECDVYYDPVSRRYWAWRLQLRLFIKVWSLLPSAVMNPMELGEDQRTKWAELCSPSRGEELLAEPRLLQGQAAYTEEQSRGYWAWASMGQALLLECHGLGWQGRGLMRKRWDTVSLGFVTKCSLVYRCLPGSVWMDKSSVLLEN